MNFVVSSCFKGEKFTTFNFSMDLCLLELKLFGRLSVLKLKQVTFFSNSRADHVGQLYKASIKFTPVLTATFHCKLIFLLLFSKFIQTLDFSLNVTKAWLWLRKYKRCTYTYNQTSLPRSRFFFSLKKLLRKKQTAPKLFIYLK